LSPDRLEALAGLGEEELLARALAQGNLPHHIGIIMDGNGRWAQHRRLPRVAGHRAGRHAVRRAVTICGRLGVRVLTLYTFSQENWKRPPAEVRALWLFLEETLGAERDELAAQRVRLTATGELDVIPPRARAMLDATIAVLAGNDGLLLNLALAYGGRQEIVRAAARLARLVAAGELDPAAIDEAALRAGLYAPDLPDPDLIVRTSGEHRLSNFLLWQSAYAEMHVTPVLWPDFGPRDLLLAVADYQDRDRRFGDVRDDGAEPSAAVDARDPGRWKRLLRIRS
jgi:undecaprenyl diphosphate synthase